MTLRSKPDIVNLYISGLSARQIAEKLGVSASTTAKLIKRLGLSRSQAEAARLRQPPTSNHWRSARQSARKLMQHHLGRKLRPDEHVHHINEDYTDRRLENLKVMTASEHSKHHNPKNPIPRWLRPERKEYMKNYLHEYHKTYGKKNAASKT